MTQAPAQRVIVAADADDVAATLSACARARQAVVAVGGGTLQSLGNTALRCDVLLQLGRLSNVCEYDPREGTIGVEAGTTLAQLAHVLAEHGQRVPFDAPYPERATVGGTLAAGWVGPRRAVYGRPRDLLIGSTVALVDGTLARAGGMVVKNVSGYDMSKVYVGSLGTLGLIVRANFKAVPVAATVRLAVAPLADDVAPRAVAATAMLAPEPVAALVVDGFRGTVAGPGLRLAALMEGSEPLVERATRALRSALGKAGVAETRLLDGDEASRAFAGLIDAHVALEGERSLTLRAAMLPSESWDWTRAASALATDHDLAAETIADVRTGDALLRLVARDTASLTERAPAFVAALRAQLGRATIVAGTDSVRRELDAWGEPPATIATMRALKARFDPHGILAPGRHVGAI